MRQRRMGSYQVPLRQIMSWLFIFRFLWKCMVSYSRLRKSAECHRKGCVLTPTEFYGAVDGGHILKYNCNLSLGKIHLLKMTISIGCKILLNLILRVKMESFEISFVTPKLCSYLKENLNLHFSFIARVSLHFI